MVNESTLIPSQKGLVDTIAGTAQQFLGPDAPQFPGQRFAPMDPQFTQAATGAVQNLSGNLSQVFDPIMSQFQNRIAPQVMAQFSGLGAAASGGAQSALSRAGAGLTASLAPLYLQAQQSLPGLAQQAGGFEQQARQGPLSDQYRAWLEQQGLAGPGLDLARSIIPANSQFSENIAQPGQAGAGTSFLTGLVGGLF